MTHLLVWGSMPGFGLILVDCGDTEDSTGAAFTQVVGRSDTTLAPSNVMALACATATMTAWVVLLVLLLVQERTSRTGLLTDVAGTPAPYRVGDTPTVR